MKYKIQFILEVYDSKYRELVNVLEKEISKERPVGCSSRMAMQSLKDINIFEYSEEWSDLPNLSLHINGNIFKSLKGGFHVLTDIKHFSISKIDELKEEQIHRQEQY